MKKPFIICLLLISATSFSQYYKDYDWAEKPETHKITPSEDEKSSIAILKKVIVEYKKSNLTNDITTFETKHNIIRVNDETGITRHNRIYISMYGVKNIIDIKARTVTKEGKIINFDKDNIKEVDNVEEYGNFKIFAIEGAESGSEIEVLYTVEKQYSPFGNELLQADYPIKQFEMTFIANDLFGEVKTYNTEMKFERTYLDNLLVKELVIQDVYPIIEEEYAASQANRIYVAYQCFGNKEITQDLLWSNTVKNLAGRFFPDDTPEIIKKDLKENILPKKHKRLSIFTKASILDNYIKTNFNVVENNNPQLDDINYILRNKSASDIGILSAYAYYLKAMEIPYEIVITSNRYTHRFDPDFYMQNALQNFAIYLPTIHKYISPDRIDYRVSEPSINIIGNYGIFIKEDATYYFDKIKQYDPDYSQVKRELDIYFTKNISNVIVNEKQEYTGHWAILYRAIMSLTAGQDQSEFKDQLTASGIEDKNIQKFETLNTDVNQTEYNLPYIVTSTIESSTLIEDAGDSFIFQVGKVIGTQSELYQERERVNPIEMQYPNQYNYTITITIPEGYALEGLESLEIFKKLEVDEKILCKFESKYKIKGNKLIITIEEFYRVNDFPKENYEAFRAVINAASDFNKAAILLSKK